MYLVGLLFPLLGLACEGTDRRECKKQFRELVSYRAQAIDTAFGDLFGALPAEIQIKFVTAKDPEYLLFGGREGYDLKRRTLIFPRRVLGAKTPNPLRWAAYYWPFYQNEQYRLQFPVVEVIDNVLWNAFLQEAATARGGQWPHKECGAVDVGRRLPCEMLVKGIAENVKALRGPLFNVNRVDQIWPDDFAVFRKRVWRTDQEYLDVQRYGGIMLIKPLIEEFGVPRTLAYVAQTPFRVEENNNLRQAALHYQERAREVVEHRDADLSGSGRRPRPGRSAAAAAHSRLYVRRESRTEAERPLGVDRICGSGFSPTTVESG